MERILSLRSDLIQITNNSTTFVYRRVENHIDNRTSPIVLKLICLNLKRLFIYKNEISIASEKQPAS